MIRDCGCDSPSPEYDDFEEQWRCGHCGKSLTKVSEDGGEDEDFPHYDDDEGYDW